MRFELTTLTLASKKLFCYYKSLGYSAVHRNAPEFKFFAVPKYSGFCTGWNQTEGQSTVAKYADRNRDGTRTSLFTESPWTAFGGFLPDRFWRRRWESGHSGRRCTSARNAPDGHSDKLCFGLKAHRSSAPDNQ